MKKISVLINSHNRPFGLDRALMSLRNQSSRDFEIIVCDDSTNKSSISQIINKYSDCKIIHKDLESCGAAQALQVALSIAQGEFIKVLHDDDYLESCGAAQALQVALSIAQGEFIKVLHDDDYLDCQSLETSYRTLLDNSDCNVALNSAIIRRKNKDEIFFLYDLNKMNSQEYVGNILNGKGFQSPVCCLFRRHANFRFFWEYENSLLREFARLKGAGTDMQVLVETALSNQNIIFIPRVLSILCTDMDSVTDKTLNIDNYYKLWIEEYNSKPRWRI